MCVTRVRHNALKGAFYYYLLNNAFRFPADVEIQLAGTRYVARWKHDERCRRAFPRRVLVRDDLACPLGIVRDPRRRIVADDADLVSYFLGAADETRRAKTTFRISK